MVSPANYIARPESSEILQKCRPPSSDSVLAVDATAIQIGAGAPIEGNLLGDIPNRLRGIETLIALAGTIRLHRQVPVRTRLCATGAFDDIEFSLSEVHKRTLAHETPHTANRLGRYCIKPSPI
jgi:hypothetical protein